jgi:hypothetical protein
MADDAYCMHSGTANHEQASLLLHRTSYCSGRLQRSSVALLLGYGPKETNESGFSCVGYNFIPEYQQSDGRLIRKSI